jgi:hypothetical protein
MVWRDGEKEIRRYYNDVTWNLLRQVLTKGLALGFVQEVSHKKWSLRWI